MSFLEELKKRLEVKASPVTVVNRGVTPLSLLGVAFIVLKVMGQITWSWWWVLAPFWVPVALAVFLVLFIVVIVAIIASKGEQIIEKQEIPKKKTRTKKSKKEDGTGTKGENA